VEVVAVLDGLIAQLANRVAAMVVEQLSGGKARNDEWFDSRHAAEYLGVHRDTQRKLAAERSLPSEQDGPGCKLYFRRSDLDEWRHGGGRLRHLAAAVGLAA
jgi:excisionase family DNA binding protein